jgi:signal peptidase II
MKKVLIVVVVALIIFDQFTKWLAAKFLPVHESVEIMPFFSLYLTYNKGVAFSFLSGMGSNGLVLLTLAITVFMIFLWRKVPADQQLASLGFALVISGALGNLMDRVSQGHVVDFFLVHTQTWAFAVFNVADSYITLGAIAIIAEELLLLRQKTNTAKLDE